MLKKFNFYFLFSSLVFILSIEAVAQSNAKTTDSIFKELEEKAIIERKAMVPMSDSIRLSTNIYRPKTGNKVPIIFSRTPYNFNLWQDGERQTRTAQDALRAINHGYAYVKQNERGRYFSEGKWQYLGAPLSDASDMFQWMRDRDWSNGKIGLLGCSSTAEWQLAAASVNNAADAMVPMGYGAGIGKVGGFYAQGDRFRGGVSLLTTLAWFYGTEQDNFKPQIPDSATQEDLIRISKFYDLATNRPPINWAKVYTHLPIIDMFKETGFNKDQILEERIRRKPNDQAWYKGGLYHDNMEFNVPSFWFASWYGTSLSPNLASYVNVRENASDPKIRDNQYLVISPNLHCGYFRSSKNTMIGERNVGDARLNYYEQIFDWFDLWLKGKKNKFKDNTPRVQYYTMGSNKWQGDENWPPENVRMTPFYLDSNGDANSLYGGGKLTTEEIESKEDPDQFTYDPMNPVPTYGGGFCCDGGAIKSGSGAFDQRRMEARNDILIYTTPPLKEGIEVTGWIEPTLYVSSDVKDSDFTLRLIDVHPDGTAYNLRSTIMRARYRNGYTKEVFMEKGKVYKLDLPPLATSNYFKKKHRIRIEISSSNFPRFARNLNTGGNNYDEKESVVAHNKIHHSSKYPSQIKLPVKVSNLPIGFNQ